MRVYLELDINGNITDIIICKSIKDAAAIFGVNEDNKILSLHQHMQDSMQDVYKQAIIDTIIELDHCVTKLDNLIKGE